MAVLALPLAALWALRVYESALVRQTEEELVAQAAVWSAAFRQELRRNAPDAVPGPLSKPDGGLDATLGATLGATAVSLLRRPELDLAADPVLPPPPGPQAAGAPDPQAAAAGQALLPMVRDAQAVTLSALRLTDGRGVIVASTGNDTGLSLAGWPEVAQVLAGAPVVTTMRRRDPVQAPLSSISRTARLRVFVALPVQGGAGLAGVAVLSRTPRDLGQAVWDKRWELTGLAALLLFAGGLLAAGLSRLVTRPLAVVVAQAQHVALGGDAQALRRPGTREVADLSAALTRMAATLDRRARYITAFAASVSHEFKTPLAGLRGAAELLEDHADTLPASERAKLLRVVSSSTTRLDTLVRRLLELARADMMRPGAGPATPVAAVLDGLLPAYRERGLRVTQRAGRQTVALPPDALGALLASLLDNAALHGGRAAAVSVEVTSAARRTVITVTDGGPGITAANSARIFEPFFTTARSQGGTGLGLCIARSIAAGAGGSVDLVPSPAGTCFRVELPGDSHAGHG